MRVLHAGESHGPALVSIIEGLPAGLKIDTDAVNLELARRLQGHGRGIRAQTIETDQVEILSGLWKGRSLGSPLTLMIRNRDFEKRGGKPHPDWPVPRPGHADLPGRLKYGYDGFAPVAERASARSTAGVVAAGAVAKLILKAFGIQVWSHTLAIGQIQTIGYPDVSVNRLRRLRTGSPLRCLDRKVENLMVSEIDAAKEEGVSLGGVSEVVAFGLPSGLGSHLQFDRRLDARLAEVLLSIPSVKAMEIGEGIKNSGVSGQQAHDALYPDREQGWRRETNRAGGLEGGMTNGMPLRVRIFIKPISTQRKGIPSVDWKTGKAGRASYVRSDTCIVPAAGVIAESLVAWTLADDLMLSLGEAPMPLLKQRYQEQFSDRTGR